MVLVFLLSDLHSVDVVCDSNYSNYLESEDIDIESDKALILQEESGSSNNYRNYFETGFTFPTKLRNDMFSTKITTDKAKYYFTQVYLNNLNNEKAFKNTETQDQYSNSYFSSKEDITVNEGNYKSSILNESFCLIPNEDLGCSLHYTGSNHYGQIDEYYGELNTDDYIYANSYDDYGHDRFGLTNIPEKDYNSKIWNVSVNLYGYGYIFSWDHIDIKLWNGTDWFIEYYYYPYFSPSLTTVNFENIMFSSVQDINDCRLQIEVFSMDIADLLTIYQVFVNFSYDIGNINLMEDFDYTGEFFEQNIEGSGEGHYFGYNNFTYDTSGIFPDFTQGWTDQSQSGCDTTVYSEISNRKNVLRLNDQSSSYWCNCHQEIPNAISSGTIEFLALTSSTTSNSLRIYFTDSSSTQQIFFFLESNNIYLYDSSSSVVIATYTENQWVHFKIVYDQITNLFDVYINDVLEADDFDFKSNGNDNGLKYVYLQTSGSSFYGAIDSLDFSHVNEYYDGRCLDCGEAEGWINLETEFNFDIDEIDNIELAVLSFCVLTNASNTNFTVKAYNFDTHKEQELINVSFSDIYGLSYYLPLNFSLFSDYGLIKLNITMFNTVSFSVLFDELSLYVLYSNYTESDNGYHEVMINYLRFNDADAHYGNLTMDLKFYKTNFTYSYLEDNIGASDYEIEETVIDFSGEIDEINEIEVQAHVRYGLNTLDVKIVNVYYLILINYNYTFELFEQLRLGDNNGNYFKMNFAYTSNNFMRENNTGLYGNYSYACLKGIRVLKAKDDMFFNRYFTVPFFDEKISLTSGIGKGSTGQSHTEPKIPIGTYWEYEIYHLTTGDTVYTPVGNWSAEFQQTKAELFTAKFPYYEKIVERKDLGNWKYKNEDWLISFDLNFMRNAICDIFNLILLFIQYCAYLSWWALSFMVTYVAYTTLEILWNYPVYWLYIGWAYLMWWLYSGLWYLWDGIMYLFDNYFIPLWEWFVAVAVPWLLDWFIKIWAGILATVLWCACWGQVSWVSLYENCYEMLWDITNFLIEMIVIFITHITDILQYVMWYLILTLMCLVKYLYTKGRGLVQRCDALKYSFDAYMIPMNLTYEAGKRLWEMIPEA